MAYASSATVTVARCTALFDWSPDGTAVVYAVTNGCRADCAIDWSRRRDRCWARCQGYRRAAANRSRAASWRTLVDVSLSYSPDGQYISLVISVPTQARFASGHPMASSSRAPTRVRRSCRSGQAGSLYFRDAAGVEVWRAGVVSSYSSRRGMDKAEGISCGQPDHLRAGTRRHGTTPLSWTRPRATYVISERRTPARSFSPRVTSGIRASGHASPAMTAEIGWPASTTGRHTSSTLQAGTESSSTIANVVDVWPHAA